jgi:protein-S-isoprenylcysteine O-methyltransferase Ste14
MFAFTALTPTAPVLVLMVASELLMQIQVRMEEAHLAKQHSQDYLHYSQRVKRWL